MVTLEEGFIILPLKEGHSWILDSGEIITESVMWKHLMEFYFFET